MLFERRERSKGCQCDGSADEDGNRLGSSGCEEDEVGLCSMV